MAGSVSEAIDLLLSIDNMRSQELRNLLVQKFHFNLEDVQKVLDRQELKTMAREYIQEHKLVATAPTAVGSASLMFKYGWQAVTTVVVVSLTALLWFQGKSIKQSVVDYVRESYFLTFKRFSMAIVAINQTLYVCSCAFLLAGLIDLYTFAVQFSVMAHWLLPTNSILRLYLVRTLSIPLSPSMLASNSSSQLQAMSRFGVDLGPMVTLWVCGWIRGKLDNYGSAGILKGKQERSKKRAQAKDVPTF